LITPLRHYAGTLLPLMLIAIIDIMLRCQPRRHIITLLPADYADTMPIFRRQLPLLPLRHYY
jgi:hypothetical protein